MPDSSVITEPAAALVPADPISLIARAIEMNVDADKLEKLLGLQERFEQSRAKAAYASAMAMCQREMPAVARDAVNTHTGKTYSTLQQIAEAIKPIYGRHGFALSFDNEESKLANHLRIRCDVLHAEGHRESYYLDLPVDKAGSMNSIQGSGSTQTYGRRYLTLNVFNIVVADMDDDGNSASFLDAKRIAVIKGLLPQAGIGEPSELLDRFLNWAEADRISNIRLTKYEMVVAELHRRIKANKNGGAK